MTSQDPAPHTSASPCCSGCSAEPAGSSRRSVLGAGSLVALAGAGSVVLSGCTQQLKDEAAAGDHHVGSETTDAMALAELPVGATTSVQVQGRTLLLHRADESTVTAFSNVCTHQGCLVQVVDRPEGTAYACPCHGSNFDVATGEPFGGPAKAPLTDYQAAIEGDRIVVKL